jgi:hypothetical protein
MGEWCLGAAGTDKARNTLEFICISEEQPVILQHVLRGRLMWQLQGTLPPLVVGLLLPYTTCRIEKHDAQSAKKTQNTTRNCQNGRFERDVKLKKQATLSILVNSRLTSASSCTRGEKALQRRETTQTQTSAARVRSLSNICIR